jgi:hypothetical protein
MTDGRPTAYKPENADVARHACVPGATKETLPSAWRAAKSRYRSESRNSTRRARQEERCLEPGMLMRRRMRSPPRGAHCTRTLRRRCVSPSPNCP